MIAKRLAWVVVCLVALVAFWGTFRPEPVLPDKGGIPKAAVNSNSAVSAAAGRPRATKIRQSVSTRAGFTNKISGQALLLGQATQAVGITYETFSKFTPQDVDYLNKCYRDRTNLLDRLELTRVLGVMGNEETVRLFIRCVLEEQNGKIFTEQDAQVGRNQELVLWSTVTSLGMLASRSDTAFDFLKRTIRPEYWSAAINWQSHYGDDSVGLMTNWAIQALGNTGRQEARLILTELLRNQPTPWPPGLPRNRQRTFEGAIISAAYMLDRIDELGMENFKAGKGLPGMVGFKEWRASEKAKPWLQNKP